MDDESNLRGSPGVNRYKEPQVRSDVDRTIVVGDSNYAR